MASTPISRVPNEAAPVTPHRQALAVALLSAMALAIAAGATWPRWSDAGGAHTPQAAIGLLGAPGGTAASATAAEAPGDPRAWTRLGTGQREALAPFADVWDGFSDARKQRWLGIAAAWPKLGADEQARLHARMSEWVRLSPEERRTARENYQLSKRLPRPQRENAWHAYQQLPEEQRRHLAAVERRERKPTVVSAPPSGKTEIKDLRVVRPGHTHAASGVAPARAASGSGVARPATASAASASVGPSPARRPGVAPAHPGRPAFDSDQP
jgi:hypothetical protein